MSAPAPRRFAPIPGRTLAPCVSALALAASVSVLVGCDPPPAEDLLLGPEPAVAFSVERVLPGDGVVAADGTIVVRFTSEVDARSVGSRSVRAARAAGRRPLRVRVTSEGRDLRVSPLPGHTFPSGETVTIRLDGAPSPRAVRSVQATALAQSFEARFRTVPAAGDFVGPRLVDSVPRDGADDVAPGSSIELRFSEPLARGAVDSGDAVAVTVDGTPVRARLELSSDRTTVVVRTATPLPPDRRVEVTVRPSLLDVAGNPLDDPPKRRRVFFRTSATALHEIAEDFVDTARSDRRATSCGWDDPETPGVLVARSGPVLVTPEPYSDVHDALPASESVHFQILLPGHEIPDGLASALRVEFATAPAGAQVRGGLVEAGHTSLVLREPSLEANRAATELRSLVLVDEPLAVEASEGGRPFVDVVFEEPLRLESGRSVLLDVRLSLTSGARIAACRDASLCALVEGVSGVAPLASLLVAPASPQARSLWYDAGTPYPGWGHAIMVRTDRDPGVDVVAEFQSAPSDALGRPDVMRASPWEPDLQQLPAYRFVRFRIRFQGTPELSGAPRLDRVVLPYER